LLLTCHYLGLDLFRAATSLFWQAPFEVLGGLAAVPTCGTHLALVFLPEKLK
jgi:hypothetical protein